MRCDYYNFISCVGQVILSCFMLRLLGEASKSAVNFTQFSQTLLGKFYKVRVPIDRRFVVLKTVFLILWGGPPGKKYTGIIYEMQPK